jgi:hypothetical protein
VLTKFRVYYYETIKSAPIEGTRYTRAHNNTHTHNNQKKKRGIIIIKENGSWVSAAKAFHVKMSIDRKKNEIKNFFSCLNGWKKKCCRRWVLIYYFSKKGGIGTVLINNQKRARWQYLKKKKKRKWGILTQVKWKWVRINKCEKWRRINV